MTRTNIRNYQDAVEFLDDLCTWPLVRVPGATHRRLLHLLCEVPRPDVPTIHVVGTCGKGSTATLAAALLQACGWRCGLFTGPHLVHYCERFVVDGQRMPEGVFVAALQQLVPRIRAMRQNHPEGRPTVLEVLTAVGLGWFGGQVDVLVLEAGLGGTRDCTTALPADVVVLTRVGLDHQELLGPDLAAIAAEKAGAVRPHKPVVVGPQEAEVYPIVAAEAAQRQSPLVDVRQSAQPENVTTDLDGTRFTARFRGRRHDFELALAGRHQVENALTALLAVEALVPGRLAVDDAGRALAATLVPGRLEVMGRQPLVLLDGAHNLDGARALRAFLDTADLPRPLTWMAGILADKDREAMLAELVSAFDQVIAVLPHSGRAGDTQTWLDQVRRVSGTAVPCATIEQALEMVPGGTVVVAGSLYLVGEARDILGGVYET